MQHSETHKPKGAAAKDRRNNDNTFRSPVPDEENDFEPPDYFRAFRENDSQINDNSCFQPFWNLDLRNENDDIFNIIDQVVISSGIQSDEEDPQKGQSKNQQKQFNPIIGSQRIETDDVKFKSLKPRSKIMRKNLESHLNAAKLKNPKETLLKGKLKKNIIPTEKQNVKDMIAFAKTESKETIPNTSEGTSETKYNDQVEFDVRDTLGNTLKGKLTKENSKIQEGLSKPKTKSQLSLKSKEYTRTGNIKNLHNSSNNSLDNMPKHGGGYHRHSLPHMPLEFVPNLYHYTPSTNYTIPSSEEKQSIHNPQLNHNMSMHVLSPVPFEKMQSNSLNAFHTLDNANYSSYPRECLAAPGNYLSNTMPLPDMTSFNRGMSYSPDLCMQPYPYYNVNTGSTGRISSNSDYIPGVQPSPPYYEGTMGRSWPKIPQTVPETSERFSSIPSSFKHRGSGRVITKENDQQKQRYYLDVYRILSGKDKRTSLMIRNIPNKYNQTMLTQELDERHKGYYDIIYLPIDPKNKCN
jgi:hypothetical protein